MWHINILNQKLYEETGEYLIHLYCVGESFYCVMDSLGTDDIRDLKIVSYEMPFELKDTGYETLCNLQEKSTLLLRLAEMESTQYGMKFKEICDHFYSGEIEKYIMNFETIKWLKATNYKQLLKELIEADYISYRFVIRFFNFKKFLKANKEYCVETIKTLGVVFLEVLVQRIKNGDFLQYLKDDEIASYLKSILNVLETPVGLFIHEHNLYLLEDSSRDLELYTDELMNLIKEEKKVV